MPSRTEQEQSERISLGLIEFLSRHTIDDDYERVAAAPQSERAGTSGWVVIVTLILFGVMVYAAASQTTRNAASEDRDRQLLIDQIQDRRQALNRSYSLEKSLTAENAALEQQFLSQDEGSALFSRLRTISMDAGALAVRGPGVRVTVQDKVNAVDDQHRVLDADLQKLVNGLWAAGAEAVAINGQRVTSLSAIREAGGAITINYRSLRGPYVVSAIGDARNLPARFAESTSGATWFDLKTQVGLRFEMVTVESLKLPAAPDLELRFAQPPGNATREGTK